MTDRIKIPATIKAATNQLNGLGVLLTAKEWQRAAIVYAFTVDGTRGGDTSIDSSVNALTPNAFADLGITGLRSHATVRMYRRCWQTVIDDGQAEPAEPGQSVTLPTRDFPPTDYRTGDYDKRVAVQARSLIARDPVKAIEDIVRDAPEVLPKLAEGVRAHDGLRAMVAAEPSSTEVAEHVSQPTKARDYSADLRAGVNRLMPVLHAMRAGTWEPDVMEQTLISFLAQLFAEIVEGNAATTDLFSEIEAYLGAAEQRS